jgi:hypothetical protein
MSEWQPIETAPRDTPVLIYQSGVDMAVAVGSITPRNTLVWFDPCYDVVTFQPTHWMPLPNGPSKDQSE